MSPLVSLQRPLGWHLSLTHTRASGTAQIWSRLDTQTICSPLATLRTLPTCRRLPELLNRRLIRLVCQTKGCNVQRSPNFLGTWRIPQVAPCQEGSGKRRGWLGGALNCSSKCECVRRLRFAFHPLKSHPVPPVSSQPASQPGLLLCLRQISH